MEKKMSLIYCFTNLVNGKKYIGSTINTAEHRYKQHIYNSTHPNTHQYNYPLYQAIRKYGIDNFNYEILEEKECDENEIRELEYEYIIKYNTISPNGYNQSINTVQPLHDSISRKKMSETKRNKHKEVVEIDVYGNIIKQWRCLTDMLDENPNISERHASSVCLGYRKSTCNRQFRYLDSEGNIIEPVYKGHDYSSLGDKTLISQNSKKVAKIDINTNTIIEIYDTIALAARMNQADSSGIAKACKGIRKKVNGYGWQYAQPDWVIGQHIELNLKRENVKPIKQLSLTGELITIYNSLSEAERATKISRSNIAKCCEKRKNYNSAGGYVWRYINE